MYTAKIDIMQRIGQVVAFKRLKTTGKSLNWQAQKSGRGRSQEVVFF